MSAPTKALKNPGTAAPRVTTFDDIPHPLEFLRKGGVPGVEYLYILTEQQADAQEDGWSPIIGVPAFRVGGLSATLMARGEPIPGTQPGSIKCKFHVSKALKAATIKEDLPKLASPSTPKVMDAPAPASKNPALQKSATS